MAAKTHVIGHTMKPRRKTSTNHLATRLNTILSTTTYHRHIQRATQAPFKSCFHLGEVRHRDNYSASTRRFAKKVSPPVAVPRSPLAIADRRSSSSIGFNTNGFLSQDVAEPTKAPLKRIGNSTILPLHSSIFPKI